MKVIEKTKLVVRHLPAGLTEAAFIELIGDFARKADWLSFMERRCYINFPQSADLISFASQFDGHTFIDNAGKEARALVEYAPSQKVPKKKKTADPKTNTIATDPVFIKFEAQLNAPREPSHTQETIERLVHDLEIKSKPTTTPLLDYLRTTKKAKSEMRSKKREERKERISEKEPRKSRKDRRKEKDVAEPRPEKAEPVIRLLKKPTVETPSAPGPTISLLQSPVIHKESVSAPPFVPKQIPEKLERQEREKGETRGPRHNRRGPRSDRPERLDASSDPTPRESMQMDERKTSERPPRQPSRQQSRKPAGEAGATQQEGGDGQQDRPKSRAQREPIKLYVPKGRGAV